MFDYGHLNALLAVEREGSFDAAARSLGITSSAVSQRIKLLEERLGALAINRCRPIQPTPIGTILCRHAETVALLERQVVCKVGQADSGEYQKHKIKIAMSNCNLSSWFIDVLVAEEKRSGAYLFEIVVADQERITSELRQGKTLAAISTAKEPVQGFNSTSLGLQVFRATASPCFVEQFFPEGVDLGSLQSAPSMRNGSQDSLQERWIEKQFGQTVMQSSHVVPSSLTLVAACRKGISWGVSPALLVDEYIEQGELVELIPNSELKQPLYWHCSRAIVTPLRDFRRRLMEIAAQHLEQSSELAKDTSTQEEIGHS